MTSKLQYTEEEADEAVAFLRHLKAHKEVQEAKFFPGQPMCKICGKTSALIVREVLYYNN